MTDARFVAAIPTIGRALDEDGAQIEDGDVPVVPSARCPRRA